jgi:adenosylcobinamide amidohydrolase
MNRVIIDVYGDGSVVVCGEVGELVEVQIPEDFNGKDIRPWAEELEKLGLDLVSDELLETLFQITELAVTKQE